MTLNSSRTGPLAGLKVVELAGIGPGPMCAMLLADLGARVLRIDRPEPSGLGVDRPRRYDLLLRNRPVVRLDLKNPAAQARVLDLVAEADLLIEGFRPGVAERLGLGPDPCLGRNPALVYGRMTGWGQSGPLAKVAGHDINYIAVTGALHAIGRNGQLPSVPLNLVGDMGGGALYLAFGLLAALTEARVSSRGQVVDAGIVDGVASMMTQNFGSLAADLMTDERGSNITDSGAPFYDVYACADGRYLSVGAIEGKFYRAFVTGLGLDPDALPSQWVRSGWPDLRAAFTARIATCDRDEWAVHFAGIDACVAPVLTMEESLRYPHLRERGTYIDIDGVPQPAPAPRFSRTVPATPLPADAWDGLSEAEILADWRRPG